MAVVVTVIVAQVSFVKTTNVYPLAVVSMLEERSVHRMMIAG